MAPASNWISFPVPPPSPVTEAHPFPFPFFFPSGDGPQPPLKLEDYLGVQRSWPVYPCFAEQDASSLSTIHDVRALAPPARSASSEVEESSGSAATAAVAASGSATAAAERSPTSSAAQRTSVYRGVTRHRWTGRYEAHLWDNTCRREGMKRKGRQVYLGGYDKEDRAAIAYDLAALKYWGLAATTNFPVKNYTREIEEMKIKSKQEFIASLRRKSSGFSRGASIYRGVTRHHQQGRWQARIGRVAGNKDLYLGTFATEEEAAEAYDIAAIKFRGGNAVTNFELSRYDMEAIANTDLPIGGSVKRLKQSLQDDTDRLVPAADSDTAISQCPSTTASTLLHNLLHLPCAAVSSAPLVYYGFSDEGVDLSTQIFHWFPTNTNEHSNQINQSTLPEGDIYTRIGTCDNLLK